MLKLSLFNHFCNLNLVTRLPNSLIAILAIHSDWLKTTRTTKMVCPSGQQQKRMVTRKLKENSFTTRKSEIIIGTTKHSMSLLKMHKTKSSSMSSVKTVRSSKMPQWTINTSSLKELDSSCRWMSKIKSRRSLSTSGTETRSKKWSL